MAAEDQEFTAEEIYEQNNADGEGFSSIVGLAAKDYDNERHAEGEEGGEDLIHDECDEIECKVGEALLNHSFASVTECPILVEKKVAHDGEEDADKVSGDELVAEDGEDVVPTNGTR